MSLIGPVIAATLPLMRSHAESLMTSRCDVHRLTVSWDEALQKSVTTYAPMHTSVPCHVESPAVTAQTLTGGEVGTAETPVVRVPYTITDIKPDDRVTVTGGDVMWVTRAAPEDATHPVEVVVQCRWTR